MNTTIQPSSVDLVDLADRIVNREKEIDAFARNTVDLAIAQGEDLLLAEENVPRGEWKSWLNQNFPKDARQARRYMQLARAKRTHASVFNGVASIRGALRLIAIPEAGRRRRAQPADNAAAPLHESGTENVGLPSARVIPNLAFIADWISSNRDQIVTWPAEEQMGLKNQLQPMVDLYNLLVAETRL